MYADIKTFGCLCFDHSLVYDKDTFKERSRRCIFIGYLFGNRGWKLYDLETEEIFVSRNVEEIYPYHTEKNDPIPDSFPISVHVIGDYETILAVTESRENSQEVVSSTDEVDVAILMVQEVEATQSGPSTQWWQH